MTDLVIAPATAALPAVRGGAVETLFAAVAVRRTALWWCGLTAMLTVLVAPILAVAVPPLADYPNHLARAVILATRDSDPVLQRMFAVHWTLIPNLGVDLLLPPLLRIVPPLLAGRMVVALAVLLPTTGSIALGRACFGRLSLWQLCAGFAAYNTMFLIGTLNFQLSIGVALWGAAGWVALSPRRKLAATAIGVASAQVAFVCHLFGCGFFVLLVGCAELAGIWQRGLGTPALRRAALGRCLAVGATALLPAALYLASSLAATAGAVFWQTPKLKLLLLMVPVLGYVRPASMAMAGAVFLVALAVWAARGRLRVAPLAWAAAPLLLAVYAALPLGAKGGYWIDTRIPVLLGFLLFAGRMAYITHVWVQANRDIADVRSVLQPVTPGSRVLMVDGGVLAMPPSRDVLPGLPAAWWHYAAFALIDHRAWWADTFTLPGQQPVVALPPYDASGDGGGSPPYGIADLARYADPATAPKPSYLAGWPGKFDYVLVLNTPDSGTLATPPHLTALGHRGFAALFRVGD